MNIPSRVNPFGYDNTVPPRYTRADYLEVTSGTQGIFTQYTDVAGCDLEIKGLFKGGQFFGKAVKYFNEAIQNFSFAYRDCYMDASYINVRLPRLSQAVLSESSLNKNITFKYTASDGTIYINDEDVTTSRSGVTTPADDHPIAILGCTKGYPANGEPIYVGSVVGMRQAYVKLTNLNGTLKAHYVAVLDETGTPCMFDTITGTPFYNSGTGQFIAGLTTKEALNLANLPAPGGSLTISLPLEAAFDADVQSALNTAAAKGWTITVQYRESELTTKNIDADFLESTGTQWINTKIYPTGSMKITVDVMSTAWNNVNAAFGTKGVEYPVSELYFSMNYNWAYGSPGRLVYGSQTVYFTDNNQLDTRYLYEINANEVYRNGKKITSFRDNKVLEKQDFKSTNHLFLYAVSNANGSINTNGSKRIWKFSIEEGGRSLLNFLPALDTAGRPCMFDTVSKQPFYNLRAGSEFTVGFDTTEKAAVSLSKLPITTDGTLTVSLPAAAQDASSLVPTAINIAKTRGWTIIAQYRED